MTSTSDTDATKCKPSESGLRYVVESLISLAVAVLLVRSFAVEGYIISTGSMAPYLLGFHKQVVCPDCRFSFAVGVPVEGGTDTNGPVCCPNCGQTKVNLSDVPRNEGDQLLVQKFTYLLRRPERWEVVVFQNPNKPTQAYVKRVIGLPGESLQIKAGDVWINGAIACKGLAEQRSVRIPICSQAHRPVGDRDERWQTDVGWKALNDGFEFSGSRALIRSDSEGERSTRLGVETAEERSPSLALRVSEDFDHEPSAESPSDSPIAWISYLGKPAATNPATSVSDNVQLVSANQATAYKLTWPVDEYAYNGLSDPTTRYVVRDLMLSQQLELQSGRGDFFWSITDGRQDLEVRLATDSHELSLFVDGATEPAQTARISSNLWRKLWLVEVSTFDRQLLFSWNGESVFVQKLGDPANDRTFRSRDSSRPLVRFGARGLRASVRDVMLYRDVYYTRGDERHGVREPHVLGQSEYFFLGDNSPVSLDSRSWADAVVNSDMLIGKPFLVHLPSRPGRIRLGDAEWHVRVPDCDRMRYIR